MDLRRAAADWFARFARLLHLSIVGTILGTGFLCMSLTPSLLPRTWLVQGLVSGFSAATGYGIGTTLGALADKMLGRRAPGPRVRRIAWQVLTGAGVPAVGAVLWQGSRWQGDLYRLMGERPPTRPGYLRVILVTVGLFAVVLAVARGLRVAARAVGQLLTRWVPSVAARASGGVVVLALSLGVLNAAVYDPAMSMASGWSEGLNDELSPRVAQPGDPNRSGSPHSLVSWDSLGLQGRAFVGGGPSIQQLWAFNGTAPRPPIRVYAGRRSAPDIRSEATLAVRELQRTGAFDRRALCVIATTGTGWVDPRAAEALEYLYNGDTAQVAIQYSYLPSWLSFAVERGKAVDAARELFNQVWAAWSRLPAGHRPVLLTFGESLGSYGGESAFTGLDDLVRRVDGALWVGPTHVNPLWTQIVTQRDDGSSQIHPVFEQGHTVRFANSPDDLDTPAQPWPSPRIVYLSHASDPITWWSPRLLVHKPDWLREPRGPDVLPAMRWYPFVTFWQVTADLMFADQTPLGHGHHYGGELAAAWAAIAPPAGWTDRDTARLSALIDSDG